MQKLDGASVEAANDGGSCEGKRLGKRDHSLYSATEFQ